VLDSLVGVSPVHTGGVVYLVFGAAGPVSLPVEEAARLADLLGAVLQEEEEGRC